MILDFSKNKTNTPSIAKDITYTHFVSDVLEVSLQKVVLVDFWAPWCGPCKHLGPILEKGVASYNGRVILCKVNVDEEKELAAQLRIQSLPTVYDFVQGQPVDAFMGNISEQKLALFIDKQLEKLGIPETLDLEKTLKDASALYNSENHDDAAQRYSFILSEIPDHPQAIAGYALCLLQKGHVDHARSTFLTLPDDKKNTPEALMLAASFALIDDAPSLMLKDTDDKSSRFNEAIRCTQILHLDLAIPMLLSLIQEDRSFANEAPRKLLLRVFEALGHGHRLTLEGRRTLSALVFS